MRTSTRGVTRIVVELSRWPGIESRVFQHPARVSPTLLRRRRGMRILFTAVVLVVSLLVTAPTALAQEVLTNQSIVEMVKAGLSERVIIAKIRTSPTNFDTHTDSLIALKKNGVSEKVIEAIMSPSSASTASAAAPPPPAAA